MVKTLETTLSLSRLLFGMSVLLSPSACAPGMPSRAPAATTKPGRVRGQYCMSVSFLLSAARRLLVVGCCVAQLPNLRWAQWIYRIRDQVIGRELVIRDDVIFYVCHHLGVALTAAHLVADPVAEIDGVGRIRKVVVVPPHHHVIHVLDLRCRGGVRPRHWPQRERAGDTRSCCDRHSAEARPNLHRFTASRFIPGRIAKS